MRTSARILRPTTVCLPCDSESFCSLFQMRRSRLVSEQTRRLGFELEELYPQLDLPVIRDQRDRSVGVDGAKGWPEWAE